MHSLTLPAQWGLRPCAGQTLHTPRQSGGGKSRSHRRKREFAARLLSVSAAASPPIPIGVVVLGRLAVDQSQQGKGLGTTLLQDALMRSGQAAETVGVRAVLVQAIDAAARSFYLRFGFSPSPVDEMRLMLPMEDLRTFLRTR